MTRRSSSSDAWSRAPPPAPPCEQPVGTEFRVASHTSSPYTSQPILNEAASVNLTANLTAADDKRR
eukprot:1952768-Prorocentrum_lima.AAC.1